MFRRQAFVVALVALSACADALTGPSASNPDVDNRLLPSVNDARLRLSKAIENSGVRDRIAYDLPQIENALNKHDASQARYHVRLAGNILIDYRKQLGSVLSDGADVGAIALSLYAVSQGVGGDFDISLFR